MVCCLAEHVAQQTVATLGNPAAVLFAAARCLAWDHPCVRHQLGCGAKTTEGADFGHNGNRAQEANPPKRLQCANQHDLGARLRTLPECRLEPSDALPGGGDFGQIVRKNNPVCQMLELQQPQPLKVAFGPVPHTHRRLHALPQQKLGQAMFRTQLIDFGVRS
jgi:hypothetical protein